MVLQTVLRQTHHILFIHAREFHFHAHSAFYSFFRHKADLCVKIGNAALYGCGSVHLNQSTFVVFFQSVNINLHRASNGNIFDGIFIHLDGNLHRIQICNRRNRHSHRNHVSFFNQKIRNDSA